MNSAVIAAALLLPLSAAPESHIQAQSANATSNSAAHVNFKIIIPKVLYLHVPDADTAAAETADIATVAVMSNSHNVALTATARTPAGPVAANVILSAAARKTIAQDAVCAPPTRAADLAARGPAPPANRVICTASMP
jgi:hypothetical protein